MGFPVDATVKTIHHTKDSHGEPLSWAREAMLTFWGDWVAIIPWPLRVAIWNWMLNYKGSERIDWRKRSKESID